MKGPRFGGRSLTPSIVLFAIVLACVVTLTALWHVALVNDYQRIRDLAAKAQESGTGFHWGVLAFGSALFISVVVLLSILGYQLFSEIRWNERQSSFIASVSHELNSPLSSIKLYAQTLRNDQVSSEDRARFLGVILSDVERLAALIGNILRAAQINRLPVRPELVPLKPWLEAYREETALRLQRRGRGDEIALVPVDAELHAAIDRTLFRQVLDNLVDNALKYARGGKSRIELAAYVASDEIVIDVKDDGLGIPRAELRRVFDRFYRIEGDKERSRKGTGLGLYIVRSLVEAHEGTVEALSEGPGKGATLRIALPLPPAGDLAPAMTEEEALA